MPTFIILDAVHLCKKNGLWNTAHIHWKRKHDESCDGFSFLKTKRSWHRLIGRANRMFLRLIKMKNFLFDFGWHIVANFQWFCQPIFPVIPKMKTHYTRNTWQHLLCLAFRIEHLQMLRCHSQLENKKKKPFCGTFAAFNRIFLNWRPFIQCSPTIANCIQSDYVPKHENHFIFSLNPFFQFLRMLLSAHCTQIFGFVEFFPSHFDACGAVSFR